ncbi:MAG: DNA mismatch repair protein MutS [Chloroflexi bacterium]|nr:DNA mismatch repair protein MutS [Chloroflexota bacterium]
MSPKSERPSPLTPIRRQYLRIKKQYPQALVLFRLGDFYETFDDDARVLARELEITLTSREMGKGQRVPMAGIPHHALDSYLPRLISRGYRVALCEQLSPPGRGLVEREVVRVITPGTVLEPHLLTPKANNYLGALVVEGQEAGLAHVDVSTGEFATAQLEASALGGELARLGPAELLAPAGWEPEGLASFGTLTRRSPEDFRLDEARRALLGHFRVATLEGFGCAHLPLAVRAAGAIMAYLQESQKGALSQVTGLATYSPVSYMSLDPQTRRNLELFQGGRHGESSTSLLAVLDLSQTPMGGRLLRRWLGQPLLDLEGLERRLEAVAALHGDLARRTRLVGLLGQASDLERLANRARSAWASPRELAALGRTLELVPLVHGLLDVPALAGLAQGLEPCPDLVELLGRALPETPPPSLEAGGAIREGFSPELDRLRAMAREARQYLAGLESAERARTGIKSLKVGYNKVFGYYIEVSHPHRSQVPADYIRKQTLVGAERFYTPELKEHEALVLGAQEQLLELERAIFRQLCAQVGAQGDRLLRTASLLAQVDVLAALAEAAARYGYCRPRLNGGEAMVIKNGRHPVVERFLAGEAFVPNDTYLANSDCQLAILTGPNMSGKSTYLRQVALIALMAQIGSFVPAESAELGLVDRIFTRVGAQEDLAAGQSTFMVEMVETAAILHNATPRSLIILDEIGRGTSTYDGISIARAVAEHIHNHARLGAKTLFATHYHELTALSNYLPRARNFQVAVAEEAGRVVFLRRVIPGGADKSYGIHVAQLAGLPQAVLGRAREVLAELEAKAQGPGSPRATGRGGRSAPLQLPLAVEQDALLLEMAAELAALEVDSMTPLQAITKLYELKRRASRPSAS